MLPLCIVSVSIMDKGKGCSNRRAAVITILIGVTVIAVVMIMRCGRNVPEGDDGPAESGNIMTELIDKVSTPTKQRGGRSEALPADTAAADDSLMVIPLEAPADSTAEPTLETIVIASLFPDQQHIADLLNGGRYDTALMAIASVEQDENMARVAEDAADDDYELEPGGMSAEEIAGREEELTYFRAYALARMGHRHEAMRLLGVLRSTEGTYKDKADTLYALVKR